MGRFYSSLGLSRSSDGGLWLLLRVTLQLNPAIVPLSCKESSNFEFKRLVAMPCSVHHLSRLGLNIKLCLFVFCPVQWKSLLQRWKCEVQRYRLVLGFCLQERCVPGVSGKCLFLIAAACTYLSVLQLPPSCLGNESLVQNCCQGSVPRLAQMQEHILRIRVLHGYFQSHIHSLI